MPMETAKTANLCKTKHHTVPIKLDVGARVCEINAATVHSKEI